MIKTFRGQLADGGQDRIRLQTIKGKVGYRIIKLRLMYYNPAADTAENIVLIWKKEQTTITDKVEFTDSDLLGMGYTSRLEAVTPMIETIIFDREIFNQDIFITSKDGQAASQGLNYYIELEVIPLDDAGAEYTTLKDMRQA